MGIGNIANTGMRAAMSDMEIISNNISNANTPGFKRSRAIFGDVYPASSAGNGLQAGLGVNMIGIQQNFSTGGIAKTISQLDMSIGGNGFFVLKDGISGQVSYSRAGRFEFDNNGYIRFPKSSIRLQGYPAVNGGISAGSSFVDLQVNQAQRNATRTSEVKNNINLDSRSTVPSAVFDTSDPSSYNYKTSSKIYDSLGNTYQLSVYYIKTADNTWGTRVYVDGTSIGSGAMTFDGNGTLTSSTGMTNLSFSPSGGATSPQTISVDMTGSTQNAIASVSRESTQNGYPVGQFNNFQIDKDGKIVAIYSNEERVLIGKIAIANFQAPEGLANTGNMSWVETSESGSPSINPVNSDGNINVSSIELSNVDLTEEMVSLISAQHNFQANAQVEQTYNEVMKTIINI